MIAPHKIDVVWETIRDRTQTTNPQVIVISPDHFDSYRTNDLEFDSSIERLCIQWYCHASAGAYLPKGFKKYQNNWRLLLQDHGIGEHIPYIQRHIPDATIIPLLLQPRSNHWLEDLQHSLRQLSTQHETIIIWSVDASHYVSDPRDRLHDHHTWTVLSDRDTSRDKRQSLDVDCPSCLWMVDHLAEQDDLSPWLLRRDSSPELFETTGFDATSRLLIDYQSPTQYDLLTGITLLLGWEILLSDDNLNAEQLFNNFSGWFQEGNIDLTPAWYYHRLWAWIDMVGIGIQSLANITKDILQQSLTPLWFNLYYDDADPVDIERYGIAVRLHQHNLDTTDDDIICQDIQQDIDQGYRSLLLMHGNIARDFSALMECGAYAIMTHNDSGSQDGIMWIDDVPITPLWVFDLDRQDSNSLVWLVIPEVGSPLLYTGTMLGR